MAELLRDQNNVPYQAFPAKGAFSITASTNYTKDQIGADLLYISANTDLTIDSQANAVPYCKGAVIALLDGQTYSFSSSFIGGVA